MEIEELRDMKHEELVMLAQKLYKEKEDAERIKSSTYKLYEETSRKYESLKNILKSIVLMIND